MIGASGAGQILQNNQQGYRSQEDITPEPPQGKWRALCSGDSFAFGFGVDNHQTWCHRFGELAGLQTANLGLNGYGLDQSFLRYRRDSKKYSHQIHLFSFILDDIERMRSEISFFGSSKPILVRDSQGLQVKNFPVNDDWKEVPWIHTRSAELAQLKTIEVLKKFTKKSPPPLSLTDAQIRENTLAIFEELSTDAKKSGVHLVVLQLPTLKDLADLERQKQWSQLSADLDRRGIRRIDMLDEFLKIPTRDLAAYFIPGDYHYSVLGNDYVAKVIAAKTEDLLHLRPVALTKAVPQSVTAKRKRS